MNSLASGLVDKALAGPYLCPIVSMAMAFILLRFWPLNLDCLIPTQLADDPNPGLAPRCVTVS
jgi:hypothetical protein